MFQGIGLVLIVLILFLGSPRSALIVGITIPFAMMVAFILMHLTNIPANLLSLGAIDFGIIVDGAIVMTEAILRRREAKPDEPLTEDDVREAALQVARPIFFATLIIITAYLPLFAFQRVEAKLFSPDGLCGRFCAVRRAAVRADADSGACLSAPIASRGASSTIRCWTGSRRGYRRDAAAVACVGRSIVYVLSAAAAVAIVWLGVTVWREFLPELDEGSIWLHVEIAGRAFRSRRRREMAAELAQGRAGVSRRSSYVVTPARAQRRRHRPVDAFAHRSRRRAASLRHAGRPAAASRI